MNRNSNSKPEVTPEVVTPEVVTPEAGPKLQTGNELAAFFKLGTDPTSDSGMSPLRDSTLAYVRARAASSKGASRLCWEAVATAVATAGGVCSEWPTEEELLALTPGSTWAKLRNSRSRRSHLTRAARVSEGKGVVLATVEGTLAVVGWFKAGDARIDYKGRSFLGKLTEGAEVAYVTACVDMVDVTPEVETAEVN